MLDQFFNGTYHSVQTVNKRLAGYQSGEPVKQVLFRELMYFLESRVTLFAADKQVNRKYFLVGEYRNRIIAVSLAIIIQVLIVLLTNVHVDLDKLQSFILGNHNSRKSWCIFKSY